MLQRARDVLVLEGVSGRAFDALASRYVVDFAPDLWRDRTSLEQEAARSRCLVVRNKTPVDQRLLERAAGRLRIIARAGVGLDNIDLAAADSSGVVVLSALGMNARSVAELTLGFAIALSRRIAWLDQDIRQGGWDRQPGSELQGRTWGLIGLGQTGAATARLAHKFGMKVIGFDPIATGPQPRYIRLVDLESLARASDIISLHVPATSATHHLVNSQFLQRVKRGALLINVARGVVVDESALAQALASGVLGGVALDVRPTEPATEEPFAGLSNVLLTPHIGGMTVAAQERIASTLCRDIKHLFEGRRARFAVGSMRTID